jgi:flagellar hook-basal body complex protein FliE
MAKNTQKTARIVAVMKKLHRLEEMHKIELQRQLNELRRSEEDIIGNLNREDILHGLVLDTSHRFLRTLGQAAERVSQAQQQHSKKLQERAGKVRQAEKLHDTVSRRTSHAENEKHLTEVIERYAGKRGASLP